MQVLEEVGHRQQDLFDVVGDLLGGTAVRITGEGAVEVPPVEWRDAGAGHRRREVGGRQHDHPAADVARLEGADQLGERDLPLVLVPVVASHEEGGRPRPVADDRDRHGDGAVRRARHGVGEVEPAHLLPLLLEVDLGPDLGVVGHRRRSSFRRPVAGDC